MLSYGMERTVKAEDREYTIYNANFDVQLTKYGDAHVKETWIVGYVGEYSRFYKDIHRANLSATEEFEGIAFKGASINRKKCLWQNRQSI